MHDLGWFTAGAMSMLIFIRVLVWLELKLMEADDVHDDPTGD